MTQKFRVLILFFIAAFNLFFIQTVLAKSMNVKMLNSNQGNVFAYVFKEGVPKPIIIKDCGNGCEFQAENSDQIFIDVKNVKRGYRAEWAGACLGSQFNRCYLKKEAGMDDTIFISFRATPAIIDDLVLDN